jgi:hypothetical protein
VGVEHPNFHHDEHAAGPHETGEFDDGR